MRHIRHRDDLQGSGTGLLPAMSQTFDMLDKLLFSEGCAQQIPQCGCQQPSQSSQQIGGTFQNNGSNDATYKTTDGWTVDAKNTGSDHVVTMTDPNGHSVQWDGDPHEHLNGVTANGTQPESEWTANTRTMHLGNHDGTVVEGEAGGPGTQMNDVVIFDGGEEMKANFNSDGTVNISPVINNPSQTVADEGKIDSVNAAQFDNNNGSELTPWSGTWNGAASAVGTGFGSVPNVGSLFNGMNPGSSNSSQVFSDLLGSNSAAAQLGLA